ncbi:hypothetical protein [Nonomuraea jiangxiensis]|uniref:Uncharacterized protein n=1 Tax=Nonomuraea jiangxiensis TaxID=633440 RepID=A0A1G9WCK9_9ACTN|nr:hypothetical protein [Nonomuraea jiangxiensis]SDM82003.1 hypothetical protein SAMN05421869_1584 [Nonomuraea jiangxiensis]
MADVAHLPLGHARRAGIAAAATCCGGLLLVGLLAQVLPVVLPASIDSLIEQMLQNLVYLLPEGTPLSPVRLIWILLSFVVTAALCYALLTAVRRGVPARASAFAVFLLGWSSAMVALGAGGLFAVVAKGDFWPVVQDGPVLLSGLGLHIPVVGCLAGVAAMLAHRSGAGTNRPSSRPDVRVSARAAFGIAALAALTLAVAMTLTSTLIEDEYGVNLLAFPGSVTKPWLFAHHETFGGLNAVVQVCLIAGTTIVLPAVLGPALCLLRARGGAAAAFLLAWGCTTIVTGAIGVVRIVISYLALQAGDHGYFLVYSIIAGIAYGLVIGVPIGLVISVAYLRAASRRDPPPSAETSRAGALRSWEAA